MIEETIIDTAFKRRIEEIKDDIEAGRITFQSPPPCWTDASLQRMASNLALLIIAKEARWN